MKLPARIIGSLRCWRRAHRAEVSSEFPEQITRTRVLLNIQHKSCIEPTIDIKKYY